MSHSKTGKLLPFLFLLTLLFLIMEIAAYSMTSQGAIYVFTLIKKRSIQIPFNVFEGQLWFLLAQLALHIVYTLIIWLEARLIGHLFNYSWSKTCRLGFIIWFGSTLTVLFANQVFYPASGFALLTASILPPLLAMILMIMGVILVIIFATLALATLLKILWQKSPALNIVVLLIGCAGYLLFLDLTKTAMADTLATSSALPNVIIIGVDSLRVDYTDFGGYQGDQLITPNLDKFLQSATIFNQAYTALARTFPSWTAILTGAYPIHNGARSNLAYQVPLQLQDTLGNLLQQAGYTTIYATDDRRFSNISHRYGFNKLIGPKEGANDFVLGAVNDLPLSNLILNTRLGQYLFPYSYGNRAAFANYKPEAFNAMVERKLLRLPKNKPVFLAIHFCLPHWPYTWADQVYTTSMLPVGLYTKSVERADQQVASFIAFLQVNHFLDHAIVIVISDHGESLLKPHDRIIDKGGYVEGPHSMKNVFTLLDANSIRGFAFDTSYGHGTDVLSLSQYHTVLAFRTFGMNPENVAGHVKATVSMIDIKPTILTLLHLPAPGSDGISLTPFIYHSQNKIITPPIFLETGFTPDSIKGANINIQNTLVQGIKIFKILPNDKLIVKPAMKAEILASKERAVIYQNWVLALYPRPNQLIIPVLVNRETGEWTEDLTSNFAKQSPAKLMFAQLKELYGNEITYVYPNS
ncbi:MAG: hypothetical protein A3E87_00090 [Gammaproteobacteria bacterium RIFCSPHIGHO2_12_FULL_35_23]|nr:MAG: hypothetical protein A3E87_00090 [Gammaproteobacteria bacterium RIFCSPHIGHO2_12_FULL_35_23]